MKAGLYNFKLTSSNMIYFLSLTFFFFTFKGCEVLSKAQSPVAEDVVKENPLISKCYLSIPLCVLVLSSSIFLRKRI